MKLEELQVYQLSMELGDKIWEIVINWDYFLKDTIGKQLLRAADSVAANLSEGFGRFFYKENKQFCYYSRGSLFETIHWTKKSNRRKLLTDKEFKEVNDIIDILLPKLNSYINYLDENSKKKKSK